MIAELQRSWRKMTRAERRQSLRTLWEIVVVLGCFIIAIGLPRWVEYFL